MFQEIVNIVLNSSVIICDSEKKNEDYVETCNKCLKLEAELVKKNDVNIELSKRFSNLKQHCISLEVAMKLNKEIFQKDKSSDNQNHPEIQEYFKQNDLKARLQAKDTVISKLKEIIHSLRQNVNPTKVKKDIDEIETINIELEHSVAKLLSENEKLHKEKEHLKKTYKELYDSIKPPRVHAKEQCDSLIANLNSKSMENADLKAQIQEKVFANATLKNELRKLKGKNVIDTNKDKKVRFAEPITSSSNTQKHVDSHKQKDSDQPLLYSTGVIGSTGASGSKPISNTKNNRISQSSSRNKTNKVEDQSRSVKSMKNKKNCVAKTKCNAYVMQFMLNANSKSVCAIRNECLFDANHVKCVLYYVHDVNVLSKSKPAKHKNKKQIWKPTGKVYTEIGYKWKPTGRTFTIVGNKCPITWFTFTKVVPLKETTTKSVVTPTQGIMVYSKRPKAPKFVVQIILWYLDSECSKHMTENRSQLTNFVNKFLGIVKFGNDQIAKIMGYGDYQIRNVTISRVYYVEGLEHNLFSVGQFCDSDLEVSFRKHTCFVRNLKVLTYVRDLGELICIYCPLVI
ncbi:hypothetical protein Tco_0155250 [Tanacetum coccineum]